MFNPVKQVQQVKQGNFDPANPLMNRLSVVDPVEAARKKLLVGDKSDDETDAAAATTTTTAPSIPTTMSTPTQAVKPAITTPRVKQKSVAATALLNG